MPIVAVKLVEEECRDSVVCVRNVVEPQVVHGDVGPLDEEARKHAKYVGQRGHDHRRQLRGGEHERGSLPRCGQQRSDGLCQALGRFY